MTLWRLFYSTILDALFPIPRAEEEVLALGPVRAREELPRALHPRLSEAAAVFAYKDERVSRLIWAIKYKKSRECAAIAGHALYHMLSRFRAAVPCDMDIVLVPMPIANARRRERGFNQCELIMEEIRRQDSGQCFLYAPDILRRVRHTSRQTTKDREGRIQSAHGLFAVNEKAVAHLLPRAQSLCVVIVDDVITTGSTMSEAIRTLRKTGFAQTFGLSVAH